MMSTSNRYLLDTNAVSDLVHNPQGSVADRVRKVGVARVCTSIVVAAELRYGATRRNLRKLSAQVEAVLSAIDILAFEAPADEAYAHIRVSLERAGRPIGGNDLLIAAQAFVLGHTVVTDDGDFARIPGLRCENWLRSR
jgi:tRNA(fMet)-specific endonuclease VapC